MFLLASDCVLCDTVIAAVTVMMQQRVTEVTTGLTDFAGGLFNFLDSNLGFLCYWEYYIIFFFFWIIFESIPKLCALAERSCVLLSHGGCTAVRRRCDLAVKGQEQFSDTETGAVCLASVGHW